jgi:hypothetical protein
MLIAHSLGSFQLDANRTMIAAHDIRMDARFFHRRAELRGNEEVIDSPTDIPFPRFREMTPP